MKSLQIQFQGATGTVTGSRFRVDSRGRSVLVDCGLFQGPKEIRQKNWQPFEEIQGISEIFLTHAHIDHSGLLPLAFKKGFRAPVFCSQATADLCRILLPDSGRLHEEDARFLRDRKLSHFDPPLPLYTEQDAFDCLELFNPIRDDEWIALRNSDIQFRMSRSGHILGSRFVELSTDSKRILFSGDLGPNDPLLLKSRVSFSETDYLVLESTYGDRNHETGDRFQQLADIVTKVIGRSGTLVIPAFAIGRTQEILYILGCLTKDRRIPKCPVYLDSPMAIDATDLYLKYADELRPEIQGDFFRQPLECLDFRAVRSPDESMLVCMDDSPKIVVSAAGMLTGGRVLHHLKMKLPHEKNGVLFVGYQVPESKGWLLKNGLRDIRIHHQKVDIEAEIFAMDSLSAHADSDDILRWCREFHQAPKETFLVHGEDTARRTLAYRLKNELGWKVSIPKENERVNL